MKPTIDSTHFGSITISGHVYEYDVVIRLNGQVKRRNRQLSEEIYGTSHKVSLDEAIDIFDTGAQRLIIGTGQTGYVDLSFEAAEFFRQNRCSVQLLPTPQAIKAWNAAEESVIGLFHVTC